MYDSINNDISDDDESKSLLPSPHNGGRGGSRQYHDKNKIVKPASHTSLVINRFLIILLLAGLVAVSIWLQSFQAQLNGQLSTDEAKIKVLEATVLAQGKIIERFNESVTNADVVDELHSMEDQWSQERLELFQQLTKTKADVEAELNSTMVQLDKTVKTAEAEIQDQVDTVKKNFDQYVIKTEDRFSLENDFMIYQVAGTFTILSCLISMWHMGSHTRNMNQPAIQRKILAILWMCPIYAVSSCLSLIFPQYAGYLAIVKDFYESYIIYQFLSFCISAIGGGDRNKVIDALAKEVSHLTPPFRLFFCCCKPHYEDDRALASAILLQCQAFAMQFIFWKPVTSIASFVLKRYDYFGPFATNAMDWKSFQFWINIIQNISTFIAFAGLLKFYHAVDKDLEWCRPFAKFLCIKGVVFMTFWQGSALKIMAETTSIGGDGADADDWSEQVQNFLIALEMLLFSIAHFYCFPVEEWQPGYKVNYRKAKFGETMALNDFFTDLKIIMTADGHHKKKKKRSKKPSEDTILEEDGESETQDESVRSGMDSSIDEEDPKEAFVRALATTVDAFEDDNDDNESQSTSTTQQDQTDYMDAQQRLGHMLDDMLFSPRTPSHSVPSSPMPSTGRPHPGNAQRQDTQSSSGSGGDDENDDGVQHENHDVENENEPAEEIDEEAGYDNTNLVDETSGLLTGNSSTSLTNNLRPSIFTTISRHQSREEGDEDDDEERPKESQSKY